MTIEENNQKNSTIKKHGHVFAGMLKIVRKFSSIILHPFRHHFRKRYLGKYKHPHHLFVIDMFLIGIIITLLGTTLYLLFFQPSITNKINLRAETNPEEIISGERLTFTIYYENNSEEKLDNAQLLIRLPEHFEFSQSFPKEFDPRIGTLNIGSIDAGASGQAKITGMFWGEVDKLITLYSHLSFNTEKNYRRNIKFSRTEFSVKKSVLNLSFDVPEHLIKNQLVSTTLRARNDSDRDLENIFIKPEWQDGFQFLSSSPSSAKGGWQINKLAAGEVRTITISGRLPSRGDKIIFSFDPQITINQNILSQGKLRDEKNLLSLPLLVAITPEDTSEVIIPGSEFKAKIHYENQGSATLKDAKVGIKIDSLFTREKQILIDKTMAPELETLDPGERGDVELKFNLLSRVNLTSSSDAAKNLLLIIEPVGQAILENGVALTLEASGEKIVRRIQTPAQISVTAGYWTTEGEQIGRGPMPPVVGETTKYWIFWHLEPTINDLENVEFFATLPEGAEWTGKTNVTIGNPLIWNSESRSISWKIDKLDATLGTGNTVSARFEIALTPTAEQAGTSPIVLNTTNFSAKDLFTETNITSSAPQITTNLTSDRRARGKDKVVRP